MNEIEKKITELENRFRLLHNKQLQVKDELIELQKELWHLKLNPNIQLIKDQKPLNIEPEERVTAKEIQPTYSEQLKTQKPTSAYGNQKLEDYIGTNLTSKIGIIITIIGVFIGAKYAIDKELISPFMRILLGYLAGGGLIFTAIRLKPKYQNFSSVLMGGGLAITYFITYISYSFYQLLPQSLTFILMVGITIAAVTIALWYNQKIIAILGQVAAYAIPFLLSDGSGRIVILFTYISIINIGLIYLSFKKDWKILYRIAFFLTWLICITWIVTGEAEAKNLSTGLLFLSVNFFTFYLTFLSYKIIRKELYNVGEVSILLLNALIFFFLGSELIDDYNSYKYLTMFTLSNAIFHFAVGFIIYRLKIADDTVYQFITGLGLLFITIAIPVELNGTWVTLLWTIEAAILCWIGVFNKRNVYLKIASPMVVIAALSLLQDWLITYPSFGGFLNNSTLPGTPFFNNIFFFSLIVSACFAFIHFKTYKSINDKGSFLYKFYKQAMPLIFWSVLFFTFFNEIHYFWEIKINRLAALQNQPAEQYQQLSLYIYALLFFTGLLEFNKRFVKNRSVDDRLLIAGIFLLILFLANGLIYIGRLRDIYIEQSRTGNQNIWLLLSRYIAFIALAIFVFAEWRAVKRISTINSKKLFSIIFNIALLTIICNEFIHWMDLTGHQQQYKLGLSIICGLYALALIFVGIVSKQKHLRISAIILFAGTLLKLFFYDVSSLSTISKTIVLLILGVLLLVISFLYNKYKHIILDEDEMG